MARKTRNIKVVPPPATPQIEAEEEEENSASQQGSEPDNDSAADGQIRHLGSQLSEPGADEFDEGAFPPYPYGMGANQSSEHVNTAIHSAAEALRLRSGNPPKPTGKLRETGRSRAASSQKALPTALPLGGSPYDALQGSPDKRASRRPTAMLPAAQISPRRSDRRKAAANAEAREERGDAGEASSSGQGNKTKAGRTRSQKSATAAAAEDAEGDNIDVHDSGPTNQRRKPGRPPKRKHGSSSRRDAENAVEVDGQADEESPRQPKRTRVDKVQTKSIWVGPDESDSNEDKERHSDQQKLCGQWEALQQVFKNLRQDIGKRTEENEVIDRETKALVKMCKKVQTSFSRLRRQTAPLQADHDPHTVLEDLIIGVRELQGLTTPHPTGKTTEAKINDVYFSLIPELVKVLRHAVLCYLNVDNDPASAGQITFPHLKEVQKLVGVIVLLGETARKYKIRPSSGGMGPIHDGIVVPLRKVEVALTEAVQRNQAALDTANREENEARQRALRLEREEAFERQRAQNRVEVEKWEKLHEERRAAEPGFMRPAKMDHLVIPSNIPRENDYNGREFSRQEVFFPRVGPSPVLIDAAAKVEWTEEEILALCAGLKNYAGDRVFERIFRKYCGKELNRFNVTEIVTTAAMMRGRLIEAQRRDEDLGGVVEQWVLDIPTKWTKGQPALGKENDDSLVD